MATLADELLNDFEESGSEDEGKLTKDLFPDGFAESGADTSGKARGEGMELDGDEEEVDDEEADADVAMDPNGKLAKEMGEAEATKAKVDKMRLGNVNDVRSVASLMKTLQPILDVSSNSLDPDMFCLLRHLCLHWMLWTNRPDLFALPIGRKYLITNRYHPRKERRLSARSKIIQSIIYLLKRTPFRLRSIMR